MAENYRVSNLLSKNRAEELGYDVWKHFVIPPFYNDLDLRGAQKPRLIIGGRGCGKTMLLRYLSHQSMFSPDRPEIPEGSTSHIGLFWRTDTNFASLMHDREISEDEWQAAFGHFAALLLGIEIIKSLKSIAQSKCDVLHVHDVANLQFSRLKAFDEELVGSPESVQKRLEEKLWQFESWVSNVRKIPSPRFLPGERFLLRMIEQVKEQIPSLAEAGFYVYVDEYENLQTYQQEVVNAWLKHSEHPLIFNIAMKRNAFRTLDTTGPQALSDIHDFRKYDLEDYILKDGAGVFLAEIVLSELSLAGVTDLPIKVQHLHDPDKIEDRKEPAYREEVLRAVAEILPDVPHKELGAKVLTDKALSAKLLANIGHALEERGESANPDCFMSRDFPEASIIMPALLARSTNSSAEVLTELQKLSTGADNRFSGKAGWVHNNFIASLLQLYAPFNRACPFYAGFNTFIALSRGNIRHFLELCHKSFEQLGTETGGVLGTVDPELQAEAARQTSAAFLGEIRSFGPRGNNLHTFVLRLGSIFTLSHLRPSLSENEQSHFAVIAGDKDLAESDEEFLREAVKWSVLFEEKETKSKDPLLPISSDYVLNPIYAPYFHISYRKKRKLSLKTDQVICLIRGSYDEVATLFRDFSRKWKVSAIDSAPTLFSHLGIE